MFFFHQIAKSVFGGCSPIDIFREPKTELFRISTLETLGNCRNPSNSDFVHAEMAVQVMPPARGLPKSGSLHALGSVKRT